MAMDSASWHCCTLCLQVSLNLFGSWSMFFIHHFNKPLLQSFINFSRPSTSREVSYSAMGCKLLDEVAHSGHRNIKISGDGLVALRLSMLFHNFGSQILIQLFALSFLHAWYESTFLNFNWLQVWFLYYQHLLLTTGEFKYKLKEQHMLEIQLFLTILKRCQTPFFEFFVCFSNANKIKKHVNTKAFVIATIFWEKWCIIWQKCRGANIFDHDYI